MAGVTPPTSHPGAGLPLGLTGATAATRYVGATASGAPASGTFAVGDFVIDRTGSAWVCTVAGSPGTWVQLGAGGGAALRDLLHVYTITGAIAGGADNPNIFMGSLSTGANFSNLGNVGNLGSPIRWAKHSSQGPQWGPAYDTYPNFTAANPVVAIDLFAAKTVYEVRIFGYVNNGAGINGPSAVLLAYSDDNSTYTTFENRTGLTDTNTDNPWCVVFDTHAQTAHRYWRYTVTRNSGVCLIHHELLGY